ncbi:p-aminobenzoyl-glutamate hydrolase subunit B [Fervidicola ferrireducens]|uniref:Peptidase M20 domain-containing protein 2 n=1 Tax=Fervidicola ferrireducens TaxID=520764 RepID=A0A140L7U7_9FIRM|nr:M20 family metallopeptidase [Fervidicola ferrireducens]KXG76622.1 p-aminobenzoyl-glutamate hydrolase subunit B [Fervidicola ferrireducens]
MDLKDRIVKFLDDIKSEIFEVSDEIYNNPELGNQEFKASRLLKEKISKYGFSVEEIEGLPTAFVARKKGRKPGCRVAFLAEYDALPEIGHACGHNLIAAASFGAAAALGAMSEELSGEVLLIGCPAEETNGAKVILVEKGVFDEVDAAMMVHPGNKTTVYSTSLAMEALEFEYEGKAAHAAAAPHLGINALDAVILLFNGINALRQQLRPDARIHGIITEGGKAPNIIPDRAVARFYVRAKDKKYMLEVKEKVIACARGAELATGAKLSYRNFELGFDNLVTNRTMADAFKVNLQKLGCEDISEEEEGIGSTDMGNVSQVVPAIHPHIAITEGNVSAHSVEFLKAAGSERGKQAALVSAKALALTGLDLMTDEELMRKVKEEFEKTVK